MLPKTKSRAWLLKCTFTLLFLFNASAVSASPLQGEKTKDSNPAPKIFKMQKRAAIIDALLLDKLENTLPSLMRRSGIDMWILISREYNEDPVLKTMLPATWINARRRTILVLFDNGENVERYAVARYGVSNLFKKSWDKEKTPDQWQGLVDLIQSKNPKAIGVNQSTHFALADGLTVTDKSEFINALPTKLKSKVTSAENLAVAWLETRTAKEMQYYPTLIKIGHNIIAKAFSNSVVKPGITSTDDVVWWLRNESRRLGLTNWFHPTVSIQRSDNESFDQLKAFSDRPAGQIIQRGDLLHVDFGVTYLRLNTDQQQHAYVLKVGETDAPDYLKQALKNGNRVQDIFTGEFALGRTGNDILKTAREKSIAEGLKPAIYTHPIGYHGHAAGPTIGMWDAQGGVPVRGDYPLYENTAYSIELNAATFISQWNKEIRIMLEEEAFFDGKRVKYLDGRQTKFHLIK